MSRMPSRQTILPALLFAALAMPAAAQDARHPPAGTQPPAAQPATPGPGGTMTGTMMQMMRQMMAGMMQDRSGMHRGRMMGMEGMGMMGRMQGSMAGAAIDRVEGHIAFLKAELKITAAQNGVWDEYAAALRVNAKQLNELAAELAKAPAAASAVERLTLHEKALAARLEIARRTKPALIALDAALSDEQKKAFGGLAMPRMGMR